jgi:hypothetical protein
MKTYERVKVYLQAFLTSTLDECEWSGSRPSHFTPWERATGTNFIGGWVGPRVSLDSVAKIKIPAPTGTRTPGLQPVT